MGTTKVFGIGLPRTGTHSLHVALQTLGYHSLHNPEAFHRKTIHGEFDFDGKWDAVTDMNEWFWKELDQAYPNSKFILTVRDDERWAESLRKRYKRAPVTELLRLYRLQVFHVCEYVESVMLDVKQAHTRMVLEYFSQRPDDLLVLNICAGEGWDRLCDFLRRPVLDNPFPHEAKSP